MSTYSNPVHVARVPFFVAGGVILLAGGVAGVLDPAHASPAGLVGNAVMAALLFAFAGWSVFAWRRAVRVRDTRVAELLADAPGAGVLARWRLAAAEDAAGLLAMQPRYDSTGPYMAAGVLAVGFATMLGFPWAGPLVWAGGTAAAAVAAFLLFAVAGRRLRFDARPVGDVREIVIARDALVMAGRFYWLADPNEPMVSAEVVAGEHGPLLRLLIAVYDRGGPRLTPVWVPVHPGALAEARHAAAELRAAVPPRLARLAPATA
jgi:hypothetical protein